MTERACLRCAEPMEFGVTTADGLLGGDKSDTGEAQLRFVAPSGEPTSGNLLKAFTQGMAHGAAFRSYSIVGWRCTGCGTLEFTTGADPVA
jgi:hypothetical protein